MLPLLLALAAQFPPARATNLKVLPRDISMDSLVTLMGSFTRALGVRCNHCHVQREDQTFEQIDFSLDEKPEKAKAREMLRMVAAINDEHLKRIVNRKQPTITVSCFTCHRGIVEPRPLQQLLLNTYGSVGADSTERVYRRLRAQYYGSASYDFGEVPLADLASRLVRHGPLRDALRFNQLNVEQNPRSVFALRMLADTHLMQHDTASAITALERALALDPSNQPARQALQRLRRDP
jgi:tetratricopeptide (TPR) repeat protein